MTMAPQRCLRDTRRWCVGVPHRVEVSRSRSRLAWCRRSASLRARRGCRAFGGILPHCEAVCRVRFGALFSRRPVPAVARTFPAAVRAVPPNPLAADAPVRFRPRRLGRITLAARCGGPTLAPLPVLPDIRQDRRESAQQDAALLGLAARRRPDALPALLRERTC